MDPILITDEYRNTLAIKHNSPSFGKRGSQWADHVMRLCVGVQTNDVLDYGCGKGELNLHLPFEVRNYDPAIEKFSEHPETPSDIVVCTDVLEHIEPDLIDNVLDDLCRLTGRIAMLVICLLPAHKTLADGRNAHLIVQPAEWWMEKINARWNVLSHEIGEDERGEKGQLNVVCEPKDQKRADYPH